MPVDLNAFRRLDQMRRREQTGANARRAQSGVDHRARRAFAVGAGHVDHAIGALRIAQRFEARAESGPGRASRS